MRVLYISLTENKKPGAREIQVSRVLESFNKTEHEMFLVTIENKFISGENTYYVNSIKEKSRLGRFMKCIRPYTSLVKKVIAKVENLVDELQPDLIITSSNPIESHLIGIHLKRTRNLKWIAFFSDPKPVCKLPPPYTSDKRKLVTRYEYKLCQKIFKLSDMILMPSKYGIEVTSQIYNTDLSEKARTIPHLGFPSSDAVEENGYIVHAGKLVHKRSSTELLEAIKKIKEEKNSSFKGLLCLGIVSDKFKETAKSLGVEDLIIYKGIVDLNTSRKYLSGAKGILIIEADMEISPFLPSKFAEAVSLQRPIIAITPKVSEIRDYLNTVDGAAVLNNEEAIYHGLKEVIKKTQIKESDFFDAQNVVKKYLDIINETLES